MIRNYFKSFSIFNDAELDQISGLFVHKKIKKNDFFVREGDSCKYIAFIASGIFRSYYIAEDGKDNTYCFRFPQEAVASYSSFITGNLSTENIQAVSEAVVYMVKKEAIEEHVSANPKWNLVLKSIAEQEYLELEKRFFQLQRDSAMERYQHLIENQPHYIQEIPLQYLASYLGITQRHLSRIRKDISF